VGRPVRRSLRQATLSGHRGSVNDVVFTSDGRGLISAGDDQTIVSWPLEISDALAKLHELTATG
jgi:WD40 repeat protein